MSHAMARYVTYMLAAKATRNPPPLRASRASNHGFGRLEEDVRPAFLDFSGVRLRVAGAPYEVPI